MCGVLAILGTALPSATLHAMLRGLRARGPDGPARSLRVESGVGATLGFTRLAINGLTDAGAQPMSYGGKVHVVCA